MPEMRGLGRMRERDRRRKGAEVAATTTTADSGASKKQLSSACAKPLTFFEMHALKGLVIIVITIDMETDV